MAAHRKRMLLKFLVKALLLLHLFMVTVAVLLWGKGYVGLVSHLHGGVVHEITAILLVGPFNQYPRLVWGGIYPGGHYSMTKMLRVTMTPKLGVADHLLIIWGERLEEKLRDLQPPEVFGNLLWIEGVELTGNREPILIAYGTTEVEREWELKESPGAPTFHGRAVLSQRVYNLDHLWLIFYNVLDSAGRPVVPYRHPPVIPLTIKGMSDIRTPLDSPVEVLEQIRAYRPGVIPVDYRLRVVVMPVPVELWFLPVPRGALDGLFGIIVYGLTYILVIATTLYRILFYLPLLFSPRNLVWTVAVFWGGLWVVGWLWCIVAYRRLSATG